VAGEKAKADERKKPGFESSGGVAEEGAIKAEEDSPLAFYEERI